MYKSSKMLLLSTLTVCLLIFATGCDQPDDVITPNGRAYLSLNPERLPNNPAETVYELWVANATDTLSLGKFGYDFTAGTFLNEAGTATRSEGGRFYLDENIDNYISILISVEPAVDAAPNSPASIMLVDFTSSPTIKLQVPLTDSLWNATARYNMVGTSDGPDNSTNGRSIWFSNYTSNLRVITDTTAINEWHLDSTELVTEYILDTIILGIDTTSIVTFDTIQVMGPDTNGVGIDTISRTITRFNVIDTIVGLPFIDSIVIDSSVIDSIVTDTFYADPSYYPTSLLIDYETSSFSVTEEKFVQDNFEMPSLSPYGWKYKGWVISDAINPAAVGNLTLPGWKFLEPFLTDIDGGLLTTGEFYDITAPDASNPYIDTIYQSPPRVPLFPGEDFLTNLPAPLVTLPNLAGTPGYVFITMEPIFYSDTTNFPLFAYIGDLPITSGAADSTTQGFTLRGHMYVNDALRGFPLVWVTVEKL